MIAKAKCIVLALAVLLILPVQAIAQSRSVSGVVSDQSGPLIGVSVVEKGTTNGVSTDLDGRYSIKVAGSNAVLVFTYIGFADVEVPVGKQSTVNVVMEVDATLLDDAVVVGYGTQAKSHLTGSVAKIGGESLIDLPVSDVTTALQGQIAGLSINNITSEVGVSPTIRVRGT